MPEKGAAKVKRKWIAWGMLGLVACCGGRGETRVQADLVLDDYIFNTHGTISFYMLPEREPESSKSNSDDILIIPHLMKSSTFCS